MPDIYDKEIEFLTKNPHAIEHHWLTATPLFEFAYNPTTCSGSDCYRVGCLTQIRGDLQKTAQTPELTKQIKEDTRIPQVRSEITVNNLSVFAEWQRKLDSELDRNPNRNIYLYHWAKSEQSNN